MDHALLHTDPCRASAEEGHVIVDGNCGLAHTMTPEAAVESGQRLVAAGARAAAQRDGARTPIK